MLVDSRRMLVATLLCVSSSAAMAQTTLPRVVATGTTTDDVEITCYSSLCANTLRSVEMMIMMQREFAQFDDEVKVDKRQFCANLKMGQPPGCSLSNPPSAPGYDPGYVGNGCGNGSFASILANEVISHGVWGYNGDLNNPLPGVSFFPVCQMHDFCYASGQPRATCDGEFGDALDNVCSMANSTYRNSCNELSSIYSGAVNTFGQGSYNASQGDLACAAWAYDMEANECDEE